MIQQETLSFLTELAQNNHKEWMDANRKRYETAKENVLELTEQLLTGLIEMGLDLMALTAKQCLFRINRDIRFSANKSPYKNNFGISISPNGRKAKEPGYYLHIEPGNSFVGGGMWMPDREQLRKIRQEIDYSWDEFNKIIHQAQFEQTFQTIESPSLIRPPKGYNADHPGIEFLKLKSFTVGRSLTDQEILDPHLAQNLLSVYGNMRPFIDFLNLALDG